EITAPRRTVHMHKLALNVSTGFALALAAACSTGTVEQPPRQAPTITRIYAVDPPANSPFFSFNTGVTFGEVLIYSSNASDNISATPPPSFTQFRVEFDQPVDATKLLKSKQADTLDAASLPSPLVFSYCAPLDLANPGVEVVDIDTPTHKVVSSTCYDPATQIGLAPHVSIIPGSGSVSANATPSPFTCNSFAEEDSQNYFSKHKYGLKFNPAAIASSGDATK